MKNMRVRLFTDTDAEQVSHVIRTSMLEANKDDYPASILKPLHDYFSPSKIKILANERYFLIAEEEGVVVGTGSLENGQILTLFVHPEYQNRGVGCELLKKLEQQAREEGLKILEVYASITGMGFYAKNGYKKIKEIQSEHAGKQILMKKTFNKS